MQINGFSFPEDLLYDPEKHVWAKLEGNVLTLGVTDLGQYMTGKIFQVSAKNVGEKINPRTPVFTVESAKWIGKFRFPIQGEVIEVNKRVLDNASLLNDDPYGSWIVKIRVEEMDRNSFKPLSEVKEIFEKEASRIAK
ncbi:Glycine cleavage system H protein [Metallosphaera sp. J1]|uniref:glycine cleavage system protein H n=1 Tax=Metallosphaera javensis (ex Hofmann et al. 2022) TaxID=99938 RepID=UPI001EDC972E|nr:glycine cleavage system protein H [Metallosphaera javensis (ex Hofmann et al. 2022)]MCG3108088.1 Glycine cleavage system H protein [Metallosphaera javensis (ex Hofmann et al. 2022)]